MSSCVTFRLTALAPPASSQGAGQMVTKPVVLLHYLTMSLILPTPALASKASQTLGHLYLQPGHSTSCQRGERHELTI